MSVKHGFEVQRHDGIDPDVVIQLQKVKEALDKLGAAILGPPSLVSFVVTGAAGVGPVALPAVKDAANKVLRQAQIGMRLVAVVNLTDLSDVQAFFEQTISKQGQIQQRSANNWAGKKLLVVLVA